MDDGGLKLTRELVVSRSQSVGAGIGDDRREN